MDFSICDHTVGFPKYSHIWKHKNMLNFLSSLYQLEKTILWLQMCKNCMNSICFQADIMMMNDEYE